MAPVPGPFRRVVRTRARLIAVALLALVSLAAAGINITAADRLQSLLDAQWRGAYDILVTAGETEVSGLLPPNSLGAGEQTMTLDDLALIRSVDGIEVAAPIGEIIIPSLATKQERISIPSGVAGADEQPQAFRVTVTRHTDDGFGERLISHEVFELVVDETEQPEVPWQRCSFGDFDVDPEKYPVLAASCGGGSSHSIITYRIGAGTIGGGEVIGDTVLFNLGASVQPITRVSLVDPAAERALLGEAGDFLKPLEELSAQGPASEETISEWEKAGETEFSRGFADRREALRDLSWDNEGFMDELEQLYEDNGSHFERPVWTQEYVPLVVREKPPAPMTVTVDVEAFGPAATRSQMHTVFTDFPYQLPEALTAGEPGTPLGSVTVDASALLNPFSVNEVRVPWPGTSSDAGVEHVSLFGMNIYSLGSVRPPEFMVTNHDVDNVEVQLRASGFLSPFYQPRSGPDSTVVVDDDGTAMGRESAYASDIKARALSGETSFAAVPVGEFSLDGIAELQSALSEVPLGAYDSVGSTVIAGSSKAATGDLELKPSVSGLGLVSPDTVAIASIQSAVGMGETAPITAVRVRVAGLDAYSPLSAATIASTAQKIEDLGFTTTIVAGSSPTDVTVHVGDYAFGVTEAGENQRVAPLGAVSQRWSELGAAARADLAVSASSLGVLAVALAASALLLATVQLAAVPGRRAQASVMRTIGWRGRRIWQWMAAEELVSLAIVAAAGAVALVLSGTRTSVLLAVGGSLAVLMVTSIVAVLLSALPGARRMPLARFQRHGGETELNAWVTSSFRFSVRQVAVNWVGAIVQLVGTVVVAVSAAAVAVTVREARAAAGTSALGDFAAAQSLGSHLTLGVVAILAGVALVLIARRMGLAARRPHWSAMRAMGFSGRQLRAVQATEVLLVCLPAVAAAAGITWFYLGAVAAGERQAGLLVALAAAVAVTVVMVLTTVKEKR